MTLIVNLYGGPGTGKSTTAAGVFHALKQRGKNIELVHEVAKDMTWENRTKALTFQPYVIGKQMYRIFRLQGQVDVIISDSPILLGCHYADVTTTPLSFHKMINDYHHSWHSLDLFLVRDSKHHPYNPKGRNQTEAEAGAVDHALRGLLARHNVPYRDVPVNMGTVNVVYKAIVKEMGW